jgi:hypothetical protein
VSDPHGQSAEGGLGWRGWLAGLAGQAGKGGRRQAQDWWGGRRAPVSGAAPPSSVSLLSYESRLRQGGASASCSSFAEARGLRARAVCCCIFILTASWGRRPAAPPRWGCIGTPTGPRSGTVMSATVPLQRSATPTASVPRRTSTRNRRYNIYCTTKFSTFESKNREARQRGSLPQAHYKIFTMGNSYPLTFSYSKIRHGNKKFSIAVDV